MTLALESNEDGPEQQMRMFEVIEGGGEQSLLARKLDYETPYIRDREITAALNSYRGQALVEVVAFKIGLLSPDADSEEDYNRLGELLAEALAVKAFMRSEDKRQITIEGHEYGLRDEDRVRLMMRTEWLSESHDDLIEPYEDTPLLTALRELHYEGDSMYADVTKEALELAHIAVLIENQKI